MKINFQSSPRPKPIKLLKEYTTTSGHCFSRGSLHNTQPDASGIIALRDPRSGCLVAFGRSEWM